MLYGCAAWTLTKDLENKVHLTQRRMVRMKLGCKRKISTNEPDRVETWLDWIRRTTREAEMRMEELHIEDWVSIHCLQKVAWARKLVIEESS